MRAVAQRVTERAGRYARNARIESDDWFDLDSPSCPETHGKLVGVTALARELAIAASLIDQRGACGIQTIAIGWLSFGGTRRDR